MKRILTLASAILMLPGAATARAVEFDAENAGNFRGLWTITAPSISYATVINGKVSVPPSGNRLRLQLTGRISANGQTVPISTTISFGPGRRLRANSSLLGFVGPSGTLPTGFRGSTNLSATLRARPGAMLIGQDLTGTSVRYTYKFSERRVQVVGRGNLVQGGGMPIPFTVRATLSRRGR